MPLKTVQRRFTGNQDIRSIMVAVDTAYETSDVQASLTALLREQRHLTSSQPDNFNILDTRQIADAVSGTTQIMTALLGAVAAVSLVVDRKSTRLNSSHSSAIRMPSSDCNKKLLTTHV